MSVRLERIATAILHEINQVLLKELDDKRLKQAQVQRVEVSKDLSIAKAYFTVINSETDILALTKLLNKISGVFRHHIAQSLTLRVTPTIKFYYDEKTSKTRHLLELIDKL